MISTADDVASYLVALPEEQRDVIEQLRQLINRHLPTGYVECISSGMISYVIPLARYPKTYNKLPLAYIALAAQKNYYALHLMEVYQNPSKLQWLHAQYAQAGKKLDIGKACLRFKRPEDLAIEAIQQLVGGTSVEQYIAHYEQSRKGRA